MNAERLRAVADAILLEDAAGKTLPHFNMSQFAVNPQPDGFVRTIDIPSAITCDSVCCISGMACFLYSAITPGGFTGDYESEGARVLDLSIAEASNLFYGYFVHQDRPFESITRAEAAAELYRLANLSD